MNTEELKASIKQAHEDIEAKLTALRSQKKEISSQIRDLQADQKALPVFRTVRTRKSKAVAAAA